jgi:hypothetical protein
MLAFYLVRFVIMMDAISRVWVGIGCGFYCVRSPRRFKDKGVSVDGWSMVDALFLSSLMYHVLACSTCVARSFMKEHALSHALSYGSRSYVRKSNPEHNDNARKKCTRLEIGRLTTNHKTFIIKR